MPTLLSVTKPTTRGIARPLRVLVPLIQDDLTKATSAGLPYYLAAGEKLIEAKGQLQVHESWLRWLTTNFHLSQKQAYRYMTAAERARDLSSLDNLSLNILTGEQEGERARARKHKTIKHALDDVDLDAVKQDRQTERDEIKLHRALALEMIDVGFKTLATRLHPDKGGPDKQAMVRLNRVRRVLKQIAESRRFL